MLSSMKIFFLLLILFPHRPCLCPPLPISYGKIITLLGPHLLIFALLPFLPLPLYSLPLHHAPACLPLPTIPKSTIHFPHPCLIFLSCPQTSPPLSTVPSPLLPASIPSPPSSPLSSPSSPLPATSSPLSTDPAAPLPLPLHPGHPSASGPHSVPR